MHSLTSARISWCYCLCLIVELSVASASSGSVLASSPTHRAKHSHLPARIISWYIVPVFLSVIPITLSESRKSFGLAFAESYIRNVSACNAVAVFTRLCVGCENVTRIWPIVGEIERLSFLNAKFACSLQIARISHWMSGGPIQKLPIWMELILWSSPKNTGSGRKKLTIFKLK